MENPNFFLIYPLDNLSIIKESLKTQYILTITQNNLLNNQSYNRTELNKIISILQEFFSSKNTLSNKFQFSLLQKFNQNDTDLSKYDTQVEYLKLYDLYFFFSNKNVIEKQLRIFRRNKTLYFYLF
ncbi:unnamed protein product [Paramecium pentaurelia]|uniref:Uncharacterized protein n=1 Tax=Paramecium pentaurelia TaxID=43138 RepID=A0A8S1SC06_9CILI|nr:unnamed protein product [Paramecium pentaurelia]